jgi:uncharacterized protein (DUF1778 family)
MSTSRQRNSVLSVRLNPSEKAVLEAAAAEKHTTPSDFMRRTALLAAATVLFRRNVVITPAKDRVAIESWIGGPPDDNPGLAAIAKRLPSWD